MRPVRRHDYRAPVLPKMLRGARMLTPTIKPGDWVQIPFFADTAAGKQGEVLYTDGRTLLVRQWDGRKFTALVADAMKRERPA